MQTVTPLSPGQSIVISASGRDDGELPGILGPNPPNWSTSNASVLALVSTAPDGLSATFKALSSAQPGQTAQVSVAGANGVSQIIQGAGAEQIQENQATHFTLSFGVPF